MLSKLEQSTVVLDSGEYGAIGYLDGYAVGLWRAFVEPHSVQLLMRAIHRLTPTAPTGFRVLLVFEPECTAPCSRGRLELGRLFRGRNVQIRSLTSVFPSQDFRSAASRSLAFLGPTPTDSPVSHAVFASVADAAVWQTAQAGSAPETRLHTAVRDLHKALQRPAPSQILTP